MNDCKKAHKNNLYIGDLHSGNIMLRKDGSPVISDWGILEDNVWFELCDDAEKELLADFKELLSDIGIDFSLIE